MQELFTAHANVHDLRNKRCWYITNVKTVDYETETIQRALNMVTHTQLKSKTPNQYDNSKQK